MPRPIAALALTLLALTSLPARADDPCNQCKALPMLYRELLEQEVLYQKFTKWRDEYFEPASLSSMQNDARSALDGAMSQSGFYGPVAPSGSGRGGSGGGARAALGTDTGPDGLDISKASCGLMIYGRNNEPTPTTPDKVAKALNCKPLSDYLVAHEMVHVKACQQMKADKKNLTIRWYVENDVEAYRAGITSLRASIAALASRCQWKGSTNAFRPDSDARSGQSVATVPTREEAAELARNAATRAGALGRASR